TNAASLLFQTLTRKEPGSSIVAAVTALAPALDTVATRASLPAKVTVYWPTASLWIVTAPSALLAQLKPGTEIGASSVPFRGAVSIVPDARSQPVWHSPGAAPPSRAAFIAFAAFGATASGASLGVVTAPSAILLVVTAASRRFLVLTLLGVSLTAE